MEANTVGTYDPIRDLIRAEVAVIMVRALHDPGYVPPEATVDPFNDVPNTAWYAKWVAKLKELGLTLGYPGGSYRPLDTVTRAEFAASLDRTFLGG